MNQYRTPFVVILFFFTILFLFTKFFGPIPFSVNSTQTTKSNLFQVSGSGEASGVPNEAIIQAGITKSALTVEDAQNQTNTIAQKVLSELKKLGIQDKDIKTTNYSVNPTYDSGSNSTSPQITGYTVTQNLQIKVKKIDLANQVIDTATANGANVVSGVSFVLSDEMKEKLLDEARIQAITNAKKKTQKLANQAGIKLGRVLDVQENTGGIFPQFESVSKDLGRGGAPTELPTGENTVSLTVTLSYETQ